MSEKQDIKVKNKKYKKLIRILIIVASVIVAGFVAIFIAIQNPRVKFLVATTRFAMETLQDPAYIAYDLDVMGICKDYFNSDTYIEGDVQANSIKGFNYSSGAKVVGQRSFQQKQMATIADAKVLFVNVGKSNVYVKDDTMYLMMPDFDNLAYSITVNTDLFMKAPEFTANLDLNWFKENSSNILEITKQMDIEDTGEHYVGEDGTKSRKYRMTIPQGCGQFIWQLLGMEEPDYDIVIDLFLTDSCKINRMEIDLNHTIENAKLVMDGARMNKCIYIKNLPDNEVFQLTFTRKDNYTFTNYMEVDMRYDTLSGDKITGNGYITWKKNELDADGYALEMNKWTLCKNDEIQGVMHFKGNVKPSHFDYDLLRDTPVPLDKAKNLKWEELRDDMEGFMEDVKEDVMERL